MKDDMIYRHVAIDALAEEFYHDVEDYRTAVRVVGNLPPVQPEVLACGSGKLVQESDGLVKDLVKDCISRQAAIVAVKDALLAWSSMPEWRDDKITEALVELPSAQQEIIRCKDCKFAINADTDMMCGNPKSWVVATENDFGCILAERRQDG